MRVSAPMKSFIDLTFISWMPHRPKAYMFHKKAVVISTAAGMGTKKAIKDISTCLFYWGIQKLWDQCSSKRLAVREWKEKIKMAFIWWVEYKKWGLALVLLKNNTGKKTVGLRITVRGKGNRRPQKWKIFFWLDKNLSQKGRKYLTQWDSEV